MSLDSYNHFVCIVAGDNPDKLMEKYDKSIKVNPYVVWKRADAEKIRESLIKGYEESCKSDVLEGEELDALKESIKYIRTASPDRIFEDFTVEYDKDPNTGDAISTDNPDGKWSSYQVGKFFSIPFLNKGNQEVFQEKKGNIRWEMIHMHGAEIYEKAWDMVMNGKQPETEYEEKIFENMKNREAYFSKFGNKEMYVASNTAFWGYAFLSDMTGWIELEDGEDQFAWMTNYFDLFIKNLPDDTLLTIYECRK